MEDDDEQPMAARWFLRETLFVILGVLLWGAFGWQVLWAAIPVVLAVNLFWLRGRARS